MEGVGPARILVVEDDPMSRDLLSRRLRRKGFDVIEASDGRVAVRKTLDESPDVVLMDLSLPDVDGWEAVKYIRKNARISRTPVIALSADDLEGMESAVRRAGFDEYEPKPIDLPRLLEKIRARLPRLQR